MPLPNFLIFASGKSGTTSLYHYLRQHPQVYMPDLKETLYFSYDPERSDCQGEFGKRYTIRTMEAYRALFDGVTDETAIGEASIQYYCYPGTERQIHETLPKVKLVGILRHPIDRAYSAYMMHVRDGRETRSFEEAVELELSGAGPQMPSGMGSYIAHGFFGQHLARYYALFPKEQIRLYRFEDFKAEPMRVLRDLFAFLGVAPDFQPDMSVKYNVSGVPKGGLTHKLTNKNPVTQALKRHLPKRVATPLYRWALNKRNRNLEQVSLDPATRERLQALCHEDLVRLGELTGLDVKPWLNPKPSESP